MFKKFYRILIPIFQILPFVIQFFYFCSFLFYFLFFRFWHPGLYDDSKLVLQHIDENIPNANIFLVGFSAGTNIVQKTILDKTLGVKIKGIMCVCVVRDYIDARNALEDTFQGRMYSRLMTSLWKVRVVRTCVRTFDFILFYHIVLCYFWYLYLLSCCPNFFHLHFCCSAFAFMTYLQRTFPTYLFVMYLMNVISDFISSGLDSDLMYALLIDWHSVK